MVSVVKRKVKGKIYYYIRHNIRKGKKQSDMFLGTKIPDNIDELKQEFLSKFYEEQWLAKLEKIQLHYKKERKNIPRSVIQKELNAFAIEFTYNTQKIEGSTLTLKETHDLLEEGRTPKHKPINDSREAEAHQKLFLEIAQKKEELSLDVTCKWHERLFEQSKPDIAGKIRRYRVGIGRSKFIPPSPQAVTSLLRGFFEWYKKNEKILNPVELAALVHLKFVTIHPFGDGNGRISRLMMNYVLDKFGYPMIIIKYSEDRNSYYNALERAQMRHNEIIFLQWFMRRYFKMCSRFLK